jgi:hypothetical protein
MGSGALASASIDVYNLYLLLKQQKSSKSHYKNHTKQNNTTEHDDNNPSRAPPTRPRKHPIASCKPGAMISPANPRKWCQ